MRGLALRTLVFACGLLAALPPGWCCLAFCRTCCAAPAQAGNKARPSCCQDCCHEKGEPRSAPCHQAPPSDKSWCCEHQPGLPPETKALDAPAALPVFLSAPDLFPPVGNGTRAASAREIVVLPPPHVLHCVWLC